MGELRRFQVNQADNMTPAVLAFTDLVAVLPPQLAVENAM
jgi:hypothetical protein